MDGKENFVNFKQTGVYMKLAFPQLILSSLLLLPFAASSASLDIKGKSYTVNIPEGTGIEILNTEMQGPRFMAFAQNGDLLVGSKAGIVYRLKAPYQKAEEAIRFGGYPHSVAFRQTAAGEEIWLAETSGLYRALYQPGRFYTKSDFTLVETLPGGGGHNSRTVGVGPDHRVYVALGITGNCSDEYLSSSYPFNKRRGGIMVLDESGAKPVLKAFGSGLRNPVGFDWDPATGVLYASNNGPDHLGFDEPKEVFVAVEEGDFFGMPWFQTVQGKITRDSCISSTPPRPMTEVKSPAAFLPARSAPMAVAFPRAKDFNGRFAGQAFVAVHGSWGTPPSGTAFGDAAGRREPRIVTITLGSTAAASAAENLVFGFQDLNTGDRWARPVGLAFGPDGALYFTSDAGNQGLFRLKLIP
jgi:glucose/arabinose dehydrogenase